LFPEKKRAFEAFRSVILLGPDDPALHHGSEERAFAAKWRQMSHDQFNYTYADGEMVSRSSFLLSLSFEAPHANAF
jgi:hypothetical protein